VISPLEALPVFKGFDPKVIFDNLRGVILLMPLPSSIKSLEEVPKDKKSLPARLEKLKRDRHTPEKAFALILTQPPIF
jgi:hypothetical protein